MKHKFYVWTLLVLSTAIVSCKKDSTPGTDPNPDVAAMTLLDVSYGSHPQQKMDVYLPENRSTATPVILFAHGGSFIGGDKQDYTSLVKELVKQKYAVLNINYRLVDATGLYETPIRHLESAVKVKDQVADMGTALDFLLSKTKEWQVGENKIAMAGHSAGATLALLYAYSPANTAKVKAVVNLAGALDLTFVDIPFYNYILPGAVLEAGYRYTGYEVGPTTDIHYRAISPLYVANTAQRIPTLIVFPELNDVDGLPKQGRATFDAFRTKLESFSVPSHFVVVTGSDHQFTGKTDEVIRETVNYLSAYLR